MLEEDSRTELQKEKYMTKKILKILYLVVLDRVLREM